MFRILSFILLVIFLFSCTSEKGNVYNITDDELIKLISEAKTYYQNNPSLIKPNGNSVHGEFTLLFNKEALESLGDDGKLAKNTFFKEGSIILKNDFNKNDKTLKNIIVMLKRPLDPFANKGWVWGEYNADTSIFISVTKRGNSCVGCHSTGEGSFRDYTRIFEF